MLIDTAEVESEKQGVLNNSFILWLTPLGSEVKHHVISTDAHFAYWLVHIRNHQVRTHQAAYALLAVSEWEATHHNTGVQTDI